MKKNKESGISLIILVITIIVIIIIAGSVILSLSNNNPISTTKEALFKNNAKNYTQELELYKQIQYLNNPTNYDATNIYANSTTTPSIKDIIPSMTNEDLNKYYVYSGKIVYRGPDQNEISWCNNTNLSVDAISSYLSKGWIDLSQTPSGGEPDISLLVSDSDLSEQKFGLSCITSSGNYTVDWGDGTNNSYSSGTTASHLYTKGTGTPCSDTTKYGTSYTTFRVNISSVNHNLRQFTLIRPSDVINTSTYSSPILEARINCDTLTSCYCMTSYTKNDLMFFDAKNADVTKNVTNTQAMFNGCSSLITIPLLNTANVTIMDYMFYGCNSLVNLPSINTSKVYTMLYTFWGCKSLTTIPLLNTSKVTRMTCMLFGCTSLTNVPLMDTSIVTTMANLFQGCTALTSVPLLNTGNVTDMSYMLYNCSSLKSIPSFDMKNVINTHTMLGACPLLTSIPPLNTIKVTDMGDMFAGNPNLVTIQNLDTRSVTNMFNIFNGTTAIKNIDISNTNLTNTQIDNLLNQLPTRSAALHGSINISGNPGTDTCTKSIATGKYWDVISN